MHKSNIEKYTATELKKGLSHQTIFNTIVATSNFNIHDVANIVRRVPTKIKKERYILLHWFIVVVLAISMILRLFLLFIAAGFHNYFSVFSDLPVINIILIIGILLYKRHAYLITGFFLILGCLLTISQIIKDFHFENLIYLLVTLFTACMCFYLSIKMPSDYALNKALLEKEPDARVNSLLFKE